MAIQGQQKSDQTNLTTGCMLLVMCALVFVDGMVAMATDRDEMAKVFSKATMAVGAEYAEVRTSLFKIGSGVEEFLQEIHESNGSVDDCWLAEILLARLKHREKFHALEKQFQEKVLRYYRDFPDPSRGKNGHPGNWGTLLIPGEASPVDSRKQPRLDSVGPFELDAAASTREFWESVRVGQSELWSPLCGEILMKGFVPEGLVLGARPNVKSLSDSECLNQALALLGKFGEHRAAAHAMKIAQDSERDPGLRATAATCLGNLKFVEGLPELLKLCESSGDTPELMSVGRDPADIPIRLFQVICNSIVQLGDASTVPEMKRISAVLKTKYEKSIKAQGRLDDPVSAAPRAALMRRAADELVIKKPAN